MPLRTGDGIPLATRAWTTRSLSQASPWTYDDNIKATGARSGLGEPRPAPGAWAHPALCTDAAALGRPGRHGTGPPLKQHILSAKVRSAAAGGGNNARSGPQRQRHRKTPRPLPRRVPRPSMRRTIEMRPSLPIRKPSTPHGASPTARSLCPASNGELSPRACSKGIYAVNQSR